MSIPIRTKIFENMKIETFFMIQNAYKYHASSFVHQGKLYICLGCFTRTKEEWDSDFWNNEDEFPEQSEEGQKRLSAYKKICEISEIYFKDELNLV